MSPEVVVFLFASCTGYVCAGLMISFYQLITDRPASFHRFPDSLTGRLAQVPVLTLGGPAILMRNAIRGRTIEQRPPAYLFASMFIAVSWSFVSGLFVLHLAVAI